MSGHINRSYFGTGLAVALAAAGFFAVSALFASPTFALSEIKRETLPPIEGETPRDPVADTEQIPLPEVKVPEAGEIEEPGEQDNPPKNAEDPEGSPETIEADLPLPDVLTDLSVLPPPVRRMRELILEACLSGDVEALRRLIGTGSQITQLSLGGLEGDPIAFLREISGDGEGHEILAILQEVLEAGFVHMDPGTPHELYVWPYFFAYPLDKLDPRQRVELFRIVTAGDYEDMKSFGGYNFYRAGISPEGQWAFFVAGD